MLNSFLENIDIFAISPYVLANKNDQISSKISQILTIVLFILVFNVCYNIMPQYFQHKNYVINDFDQVLDRNESIFLQQNQTQVSFKFKNNKLMENFEKYFRMEYREYQFDFVKNQKSKNNIHQMQKCTQDHYPSLNKTEFLNLQLQQSYCLPLNISSELKFNDTFIQQSDIIVYLCDPASDRGCLDLNDQEVKDEFVKLYGTGLNIFVYYLNTEFVIKNPYNPIQKIIDHLWINYDIQQDSYSKYIIKLKNYELSQKNNKLFYSNEDKFTGVMIDKKNQNNEHQYQNRTLNKRIFQIILSVENSCLHVQVSYMTIIDLILQIQGSMYFQILILSIIANYANKNYYYLEIARKNLKAKFRLNIFDYILCYRAESKLNQKQYKQVEKYLNLNFIIKQCLKSEIISRSLFSKDSQQILDILYKPAENMKDLMNQYYLSKVKKNRNLTQKISKNRQMKKSNETFQRKKTLVQKLYKLYYLEDQDSNDENQDLLNPYDEVQEHFDEYLESLHEINQNNVFKNYLDILLETEFKNHLKQHYNYDFQYDQKLKYENYMKLKNQQMSYYHQQRKTLMSLNYQSLQKNLKFNENNQMNSHQNDSQRNSQYIQSNEFNSLDYSGESKNNDEENRNYQDFFSNLKENHKDKND